jgi:hypothetical protein
VVKRREVTGTTASLHTIRICFMTCQVCQ